ncbi:hypothetical protein [Psychrobacillus phage Perkons]|nr:hypothetical protein [Psychrobacillus phage Perkons]
MVSPKDRAWGKPTIYKKLPIYPVKMLDIFDFYDYVQCLLLPKNVSQDVNVIKMTYLSFLINVTNDDGYLYIRQFLFDLLKLAFRVDDVNITQNKKGKFIIHINDIQLSEKDFDKIKLIIAEQNLVDIDEEIRDAELEKKMREAREFLARRSGKMADLEQQITAYHCASNLRYEDIENLTIYQFRKGLARFDLIKTADIIQSARYSGMVSFKDESNIPTWLSHIEDRDKDEDILMSKESFDKMASDNGLIG